MTFIVAQRIGVSPFDIMAQDIEIVIMTVNYILDCASEEKTHENDVPPSEKDRDEDFWSAL